MTAPVSQAVARVLQKLPDARSVKPGAWRDRCPVHHGTSTTSLTLAEGDDGRALLHCFAGCSVEQVVAALGLELRDLFPSRVIGRGEGGGISRRSPATLHPPAGLTLAAYAAAKQLPLDRLRTFGLSDVSYLGRPAVKLSYPDEDGTEVAARFRLTLEKGEGTGDRFRWRKGSKPCLYGRDRLAEARSRGYATLVEGESDCHTLWCHGEMAVGIAGASLWKEARDAPCFDGIATIFLVVEEDTGGETLLRSVANSSVAPRVRLIRLEGFKDPSAMYLDDPARFPERWEAAKAAATPLADELAKEQAAATAADWATCRGVATEPDILGRVARTLAASGVAGEARVLLLLFLILVSRLLPRPVSASVKGPSSGGKSYALERVLELFPPAAAYVLTAMSERALVYDDEPLVHRHLVIYEAAGLSGEFATYLVRSLLSEGRVRYVTVEKTKDGMQPRTIEREGPTGLLLTTTSVRLHPENETRMLSIPVTDTPAQTRAILRAIAAGERQPLDLAPWHALQHWLAAGERRVHVPFAPVLADLVPPEAVRLRRDFTTVLTLVRAHALLHRASRATDAADRVIAIPADYGAVRDLVADLVADGVGATVPVTVQETVAAVRTLTEANRAGTLTGKVADVGERTTTVAAVAKALGLDKSAALRRVRVASDAGYVQNLEDRKGRPAKLALGEALPDDRAILPTLADILEGCRVAGVPEGQGTPPPPPVEATEDDAEAEDGEKEREAWVL